jgi:hypothetical protein
MMSTIPTKPILAARMVALAQGFVGISRENDREQIAHFLALFGLPFAEGDGTPVAFCASGLAWCACKAWCELAGVPFTSADAVSVFRGVLPAVSAHFYTPNPSCSAMQEAAEKSGQWLDVDAIDGDTTIKAGWLVLYKFSDTDRHVEIVTADNGDTIDTVGFNTCSDGHSGVVARKQRDWSSIWGYIRTW